MFSPSLRLNFRKEPIFKRDRNSTCLIFWGRCEPTWPLPSHPRIHSGCCQDLTKSRVWKPWLVLSSPHTAGIWGPLWSGFLRFSSNDTSPSLPSLLSCFDTYRELYQVRSLLFFSWTSGKCLLMEHNGCLSSKKITGLNLMYFILWEKQDVITCLRFQEVEKVLLTDFSFTSLMGWESPRVWLVSQVLSRWRFANSTSWIQLSLLQLFIIITVTHCVSRLLFLLLTASYIFIYNLKRHTGWKTVGKFTSEAMESSQMWEQHGNLWWERPLNNFITSAITIAKALGVENLFYRTTSHPKRTCF